MEKDERNRILISRRWISLRSKHLLREVPVTNVPETRVSNGRSRGFFWQTIAFRNDRAGLKEREFEGVYKINRPLRTNPAFESARNGPPPSPRVLH